jgi:hypothetical protein
LAESDRAEVIVENRHLVGAIRLLETLDRCGDESLSERGGQGGGEGGFTNPDPLGLPDAADASRRAGCDNDGQISLGLALILLELVRPLVGPLGGALGFPKDGTAFLAVVRANILKAIGAALTFLHLQDLVVGKSGAECALCNELKGFALGLHGSLLGAFLQGGDLLGQVFDLVILISEFECLDTSGFDAGGFGDLKSLLVDFTD